MSAAGAQSKAEDIAEDITASVVVGEAKQLEPCGDKTAVPNDEADTDTLSEDGDTGERARKSSPDNAKNETPTEKTRSTGTGTGTSKSLHELGFTDEQIAAILSSTEVSGLKSASNSNSNSNAGEDEIAHLKSLSAALVRTRDSLNRNAEWLGGDETRIVASPAESERLVSSAQEAISCLSRVVRSRGLQDKFVGEMDSWDGNGPVPVQESDHRSSRPMVDEHTGSSAVSRGAVHEWRNTVPVGAPKADVVRPTPKRRFGLRLGKRGLDK